jgi:uncharacterized Zn finger protein (UPF0148 family)
MAYVCPKGHQSTDSDYCSECGALIGQSKISKVEPIQNSPSNKPTGSQDICPDCGTPRVGDARFCEVCRHDFQNNKTGVAEAIVASQQPEKPAEKIQQAPAQNNSVETNTAVDSHKAATVAQASKPVIKESILITEKLNVVISVDRDKASSSVVDSEIKPDAVERVFPLDLDENLVGRRSTGKGIYPEIEINDPGVSRRHLKFIKQADGSFAVLELGSANGTEFNGVQLEPGVQTTVKDGDEFILGIWTTLKIVSR